jgi:hypothetical protein
MTFPCSPNCIFRANWTWTAWSRAKSRSNDVEAAFHEMETGNVIRSVIRFDK